MADPSADFHIGEVQLDGRARIGPDRLEAALGERLRALPPERLPTQGATLPQIDVQAHPRMSAEQLSDAIVEQILRALDAGGSP